MVFLFCLVLFLPISYFYSETLFQTALEALSLMTQCKAQAPIRTGLRDAFSMCISDWFCRESYPGESTVTSTLAVIMHPLYTFCILSIRFVT